MGINKGKGKNRKAKRACARIWICLFLCVALATNYFQVRAQNALEVLGEIGSLKDERETDEGNAQSEVPTVEVLQRLGGTYINGVVFVTEEVAYNIQITEQGALGDNANDLGEATEAEISFLRYRAGELEGKASIENNLAQFTIQADSCVLLEVWYVVNDEEKLVLEEYIFPDRQKPEIMYEKTEREGSQYIHIIMKEGEENPSGIKECRFVEGEEVFSPDTINTLEVYHLPNGEEIPVLQEVKIPVEGETPYEIKIEVIDNAGNISSELISSVFDLETPALPGTLAVEIIQRAGGAYMEGMVFPLEDVTYSIRVSGQEEADGAVLNPDENNEGAAYLRYKAGKLDGTAAIENNLAQFKVPADTNDLLQIWYVDKDGEYLVAEEYFILDLQKPEIVNSIIEKDGKQYIHISIMETEKAPSGIKESHFSVDGEPFYFDEINTLRTYCLPNGQEVPVQQEVDIPVDWEKAHEISIEVLDNAGNVASKTVSNTDDEEINSLPKSVCVEILQRARGIYEQGIVFSAEAVTYSIKITKQQDMDSDLATLGTGEDGENVFLKYKAGELEGTSPIENGLAQITLPTGTMGLLQVWYVEDERECLILEEQLVLEEQKPEVVYERIEENGEQYARIVIAEQGEILSGIKECHFILDGEMFIPDEIKTLAVNELSNEWKVPIRQEIDILLDGEKMHEIQVEAVDHAGNYVKKSIAVKALPEDVVSVMVPTSFDIAIRPYDMDENRQIYSDDIVVCNKSDFPVDVIITNVEVMVNHLPANEEGSMGQEMNHEEEAYADGEMIKDCSINLQLRRFDQETELISLTEGSNENIYIFSLAAKNEGTNPQELMQVQYAGTVDSSDYAIINLVGNLKEGSEEMWQSGDLSVRLVFDFKRQK